MERAWRPVLQVRQQLIGRFLATPAFVIWKHQYRRKKGPKGVEHRAGEGPKGHYKDYEGENEEEEEDFNYFGEEIEAEVLGTPLVNQKEGNPTPVTGNANVVHTQYTSKVGHGEGKGKIDVTLDPDGTDDMIILIPQIW